MGEPGPPAEPGAEFDVAGVFGHDYLYFYADRLADERSLAEVEVLWRLMQLAPGQHVLDLACGHGRIANRLAGRGCLVTGLDATEAFLDLARSDAASQGVDVEYLHGDMRALPAWPSRFDAAISWFTAFGYFTDEENRRVLAEVARVLKPGGRFVIDINNRDWLVPNLQPDRVTERGDDLMIDRSRLDLLTSRVLTTRTTVRDGRVRRADYFVRLFAFPELRDWLLAAGFTKVDGFGDEGGPLTPSSRRLLVLATR
ncbi:MAG TPA: methyltransferase domain-containing protein [Micromonosporaceae bacterium]